MGESLGRECNFEEVCFEPGTHKTRMLAMQMGHYLVFYMQLGRHTAYLHH